MQVNTVSLLYLVGNCNCGCLLFQSPDTRIPFTSAWSKEVASYLQRMVLSAGQRYPGTQKVN